jgi:hypothetical protein
MQNRFACSVLALGVATLLAACGGGGADAGGTGQLTLQVTDAPVDQATKVVVQFTGVELKPSGANPINIDYPTPRTIDLLALQGGDVASLLDGETVLSGLYDWIRLKVVTSQSTLDSYLEKSGGEKFPLYVPSGSQSGLKLVRGFTVPVNGSASFTIDFDLRKSVVDPSSGSFTGYYLKPALRLVDNAQVGGITGTVALSALCATPNGPSVYVYAGNGVTPDDIDNAGVEPVTTAAVKETSVGSGVYTYKAAFLSPGNYTVAFTCVGATDQPESSENLAFLGTRNATVTANVNNQQDFNAPPP